MTITSGDEQDDQNYSVEEPENSKASRKCQMLGRKPSEQQQESPYPSYGVEVLLPQDGKLGWRFINLFQFRQDSANDPTLMDNPQNPLYCAFAFAMDTDDHLCMTMSDICISDVCKKYCKSMAERNTRIYKFYGTIQRGLKFFNSKISGRSLAAIKAESDALDALELEAICIQNSQHYKNHPL
jgi:hypothetical protein